MQRFRFVLFYSLLSFSILTGVFTPRGNVLADTNITANISANTTWTTAGGTYIIQNTISINSGVTLTVDPGVVVKFKATSTALYVYGILNAEGTATSSIYFTSYKDDDVGGNTDGVTAPVQAGNWDTISTASGATTTLKYATVRYGGGGYTAYTLNNNGGKLDIQNSVIATSTRYGISHSSGNTIIDTTTINSNGYYGIYSNYASGNMSVTNSTFYNNALAAGTFYFGSGLALTNSGNTNSATGAGKRGFIMSGSITSNTTWTADGLPYIISGGFSVNYPNTLTINPGTVAKFENSSAYIQVGGTLTANGDSTHQIYFTSIKDDVLNDTDASATTTPSAGDWRHITVSSATANFSYATIRYGGGDAYDHANLANNGGTYNISSSTISNASYYGIYHGSGTTNITQSSLFGNGVRAYHNVTSATTTATNNYWGDSSGPYNAKYNPSGTGNAVSDYVSFIPWLYGTSSAPVLQGHITTDTNLALPVYAVRGELTVDAGKKLTVKPGVVVKFEDEASLTVNGILVATSTASEEKIYFTSVKDDTVGGDTNGDSSATTPSAGDWGSININTTGATSTIHYADIRYGGSDGSTLINSGNVGMYHVYIVNGTDYGINMSSGTLDLASSEILGMDEDGVYISGATGNGNNFSSPVRIMASDIHGNTTSGVHTLVNIYIDFSDLRDNGLGLYVEGGKAWVRSSHLFDNDSGAWFGSGSDIASVSSNSITNNENYGIFSESSADIHAEQNYWSGNGTNCSPSGDPLFCDTELPEGHYLNVDGEGYRVSSVKNYLSLYWPFHGHRIGWSGDPQYTDEWDDSISLWNTLDDVTIEEDSDDTQLTVSTTTDSDLPWSGLWSQVSGSNNSDTIQLNTFYLNGKTSNEKINVISHELGHALGLSHSPLGNMMYYCSSCQATPQTVLGTQDEADYDFMKDNNTVLYYWTEIYKE